MIAFVVFRAIFRWLTAKNLYTIMFDSQLPGSPEALIMGFKDGEVTYAQIFQCLATYVRIAPMSQLVRFCRAIYYSWHSTTPTLTRTSTPTSSRGSSRECRRVVQLATEITSIARVGRVGENPSEDVRVGVGVGVVEFQLIATLSRDKIAILACT